MTNIPVETHIIYLIALAISTFFHWKTAKESNRRYDGQQKWRKIALSNQDGWQQKHNALLTELVLRKFEFQKILRMIWGDPVLASRTEDDVIRYIGNLWNQVESQELKITNFATLVTAMDRDNKNLVHRLGVADAAAQDAYRQLRDAKEKLAAFEPNAVNKN